MYVYDVDQQNSNKIHNILLNIFYSLYAVGFVRPNSKATNRETSFLLYSSCKPGVTRLHLKKEKRGYKFKAQK